MSRGTPLTIRRFSVEVSPKLVSLDIRKSIFHDVRHLLVTGMGEKSFFLSQASIEHLSILIFTFSSNMYISQKLKLSRHCFPVL